MSEPVRRAVRRLLAASESGELAALGESAGVVLMVLFGSAAREEPRPADIDLAVAFADHGDLLDLLQRLYELIGFEGFDILDLDRAGPVARERALVGGRLLLQARPGEFANRQIAAIMERMDTDELRRRQLELMAR